MYRQREDKTLCAMIDLYCRHHHGTRGELCPDCRNLLSYARNRLGRCPYGTDKPTCSRCPIHCYQPAMREQVRKVMRYAGPRMLWRHPVWAILHLLDQKKPIKQVKHL